VFQPLSDVERVRPLFQGQHLELLIHAVIAGNTPGQVWVDDADQPRAAFLWDQAHCLYVTGISDNDAFNQAISGVIAEQIAPQVDLFKLYYTPEAWEQQIETLLPNVPVRKLDRVLLTLRQPTIDGWRERIPAGFRVSPSDAALLAQTHLTHLDAVIEEIESGWKSLDEFCRKGFGFCMLEGESVVCWCSAEYFSGSEYVSEGRCGIGIETVEGYSGRGLATLTASAFLNYCLERGIAPHWDSWTTNLPSLAVARKVGFQPAEAYTVFLGRFSEAHP